MKIVGNISVRPPLPQSIHRLQEMAYNLWWTWNPDAQELYESIDKELWERVSENPIKFLRTVSLQRLQAAARDHDYLRRYRSVLQRFDDYMAEDADTWFRRNLPDRQGELIAYFSAEFGLHEALPIYSGGLGILSGDHCKEASDMGLPFIGVGFLYPQGYFTQQINAEGRQEAIYEKIDFTEVPATQAMNAEGDPVVVHVDLPGRTVYAKVWKIQVGRVILYLMDTDVEQNAHQDRELSARLYGGDHEMRISQEYVLGIAGVRTLRALGYEPTVWHMNEGHSAFLSLERIRELVQAGTEFETAVEIVRAGNVFTTHTPVAAGHDAFPFELVDKFFWQYWGQMGIDRERFLDLARHEHEWGAEFSMTVLAFRLSAYYNGVSALHGQVSRRMWEHLWPGTPEDQVPIKHITNGVHTGTWLAPEMRALYDRYFSRNWLSEVDSPDVWQMIESAPDEEIRAAHHACKQKLVEFLRARLKRQQLRHGEGHWKLTQLDNVFDPEALTLGFARRFATYKRATLIFHDKERLKRLLNDAERPVQLVFAGKAHPADDYGKALIERIYRLSQEQGFFGKIAIIENYDINVGRHLVGGVDVWLNTPRRPFEASGTSGQKAAINGAPNFSILDGWWREGYDSENGWAIGEEREYKDIDTQDEADALSLYSILEEEVVAEYYDRPADWTRRMRRAIATCGPQFSMRRMLSEYANSLYIPAMDSNRAFREDWGETGRQVAHWKQHIRNEWQSVYVAVPELPSSQAKIGERIEVEAQVWPGRLSVNDLAVELVTIAATEGEEAIRPGPEQLHPVSSRTVPMHAAFQEPQDSEHHHHDESFCFRGILVPEETGKHSFGVRVRPHHPALIHPLEMGLSAWA